MSRTYPRGTHPWANKGTSGHALDKKRTDDKFESVRRCFEKIKGETVSVVDALEMVL